MNSGLVVSLKDRRIGALLALSVLFLTALALLLPADSPANDFDQIVAAAFDQAIGEVQISEIDVSSLTISEQELLPVFPEVEGDNLEKRSFSPAERFRRRSQSGLHRLSPPSASRGRKLAAAHEGPGREACGSAVLRASHHFGPQWHGSLLYRQRYAAGHPRPQSARAHDPPLSRQGTFSSGTRHPR